MLPFSVAVLAAIVGIMLDGRQAVLNMPEDMRYS